jgi:hypothetical protein
MEPVLVIGNANEGGIPFHRHHEAWLLLLHGTKKWSFYPSAIGEIVERSFNPNVSHSIWRERILPTLPAIHQPQECTQLAGELMYVPEGYWHAVANGVGNYSLAVGGQAAEPLPNGHIALAKELWGLMNSGRFAEAVERTRAAMLSEKNAAREGIGSPNLCVLHGDALVALATAPQQPQQEQQRQRQRQQQQQQEQQQQQQQQPNALDLFREAISTYGHALALEAQAGLASGPSTCLKRARACSEAAGRAEQGTKQAGRDYYYEQASRDYKRVLRLDPDGAAGLKQQALGALALDALNQGKIKRGVRWAGKAVAWGNKQAQGLLHEVATRATQRQDTAVLAAIEKAMRRTRLGRQEL